MLEELITEPFPGFEPEAIKFLKALSNPKNNNKEWFDKNRDKYENFLKQPMRHLIDCLAPEIAKIDDEIVVNYKSIFRINRDIRFSKNKHPYKDMYSAAFAFEKVKSSEVPQFYFHFNKSEFLFAAGQYSMDPVMLKKIRFYLYKNFNDFQTIISDKKFRKEFGAVQGERLVKLPKEFVNEKISDENLSSFLKMKQFYVYKTYPVDVIMEPALMNLILSDIKTTLKFNNFFYKAIK